MRFDERDPRKLARHELRRVGGQESALDADALQIRGEFGEMIRRELRRIEARARRPEGRSPELAELLLIRFHPVPDIGRLVRPAFDVNEHGQVPADADRVEMIEEEEPVAAEQVLNVMLGRDHDGVHAGLVEELVEARGVK